MNNNVFKLNFNILESIKIKNILFVILGAIILAFGTYNFNYQNNITEGGILGLLLLIKNLFNISPSITSIILDFSLFLLGCKYFGKSFLVYSIISTISFSTSYKIFESIGPLVPSLSNNMLLASILAGIFVGIGIGMVVRAGGASGGDDVIALIVSKFSPLKVNHVYLITDCLVLLLSLTYLDFVQILWSLIAVSISGKVIAIIYHQKEEDYKVETLDATNVTVVVTTDSSE